MWMEAGPLSKYTGSERDGEGTSKEVYEAFEKILKNFRRGKWRR